MSSPQLLDVTGRRRSPAAMPGHNAARASQQGNGLSGGPADGRRDRRRDAQDPIRSPRSQAPCADRRALARRATDPGSAVVDRVRSRSATRRDSRSRREGNKRREVGRTSRPQACTWRGSTSRRSSARSGAGARRSCTSARASSSEPNLTPNLSGGMPPLSQTAAARPAPSSWPLLLVSRSQLGPVASALLSVRTSVRAAGSGSARLRSDDYV